MRVAVEEYLLINVWMDFLFLFLASRGTWFFNPLRLIIASLWAGAYALLDAMRPCPIALDAFALACTMLIAFPYKDRRLFSRSVTVAAAGIFVFGSIVRLTLSIGGGTLFSGACGVFAGTVIIAALKAAFEKAGSERDARFRVYLHETMAEFSAVIDTGNLLKEPLSALPVLIADEEALGKKVSACVKAGKDFREAAFASVGGDGRMKCFRADEILVNRSGRWLRAPDMWIGIYPGRMRGGVHALAPPVVLVKSGGKRRRTEGEE